MWADETEHLLYTCCSACQLLPPTITTIIVPQKQRTRAAGLAQRRLSQFHGRRRWAATPASAAATLLERSAGAASLFWGQRPRAGASCDFSTPDFPESRRHRRRRFLRDSVPDVLLGCSWTSRARRRAPRLFSSPCYYAVLLAAGCCCWPLLSSLSSPSSSSTVISKTVRETTAVGPLLSVTVAFFLLLPSSSLPLLLDALLQSQYRDTATRERTSPESRQPQRGSCPSSPVPDCHHVHLITFLFHRLAPRRHNGALTCP